MLESTLEKRLVDRVKRLGGECLKLTGYKGITDRLVFLPGGFIAVVEMKKPKGGVVAKAQEIWGRRLEALDVPHFTIFTGEQIDEFFAVYTAFKVVPV